MKKRLHNKKAGIAILSALIVISLAEIVFRAVCLRDMISTTANYGEQIAVLLLATTLLCFTAKGKDRICYICYTAWLGYFILDQVFELPRMIISLIATAGMFRIGFIGYLLTVISAVTIIAIGVLLVEYMNDGSIYNRAFNFLCAATVLTILTSMCINLYVVANGGSPEVMLAFFNKLYRVTMVFFFAFFAYDSAKLQLKKTDLAK